MALKTAPHLAPDFVEEHHHPIIQVLSHITSPLSGSLLIFGVVKFGQWPAARASARAMLVRHGAGRVGAVAAALLSAGALGAATLIGGDTATTDSRATPTAPLAAASVAPSSWRAYLSPPRVVPPPVVAPQLADDADPDDAAARAAQLALLYGPETAPLVARHLSAWPTSALLVKLMRRAHKASGTPWWATIAVCTVGLRLVIMPMNIWLLQNTLRLKLIAPEVERLGAVLAERGAAAAPSRAAAAAALSALFVRARCSPWQGFLWFPLALPPLVLSFFGAVHTLAMTEPAMGTEGVLWRCAGWQVAPSAAAASSKGPFPELTLRAHLCLDASLIMALIHPSPPPLQSQPAATRLDAAAAHPLSTHVARPSRDRRGGCVRSAAKRAPECSHSGGCVHPAHELASVGGVCVLAHL